jgi:hypothetical protein
MSEVLGLRGELLGAHAFQELLIPLILINNPDKDCGKMKENAITI